MNAKQLAKAAIKCASESIAEGERIIAKARENGTLRRKDIRLIVDGVKALKEQVKYWEGVA